MISLVQLTEGAVVGGDFRVRRPLGQGGMGAVYVAHQLSTGKDRALKVMNPLLVSDDKSRQRFMQEAKVGARVQSDHVVEVVGAGIDEATGMPWLAMELLEGESLAQALDRRGAFPPAEALEVFRQLGHALGAAHAVGLVHRDIKPDNVHLSASRRHGAPFTVKVLDFGIAKVLHDTRATGTATSGVGSPLFMAPEQTDAGRVCPASDVWALGLLVFQTLTGKHYWRSPNTPGGTLQGLLLEIVVEPLERASTRAEAHGVATRLPAGFDDWFARCVDREPGRRFPDARQATAALEHLLAGAPAVSFDATAPHGFAATLDASHPAIAGLSTTRPTELVRPDPPRSRRGLLVGGVAALAAIAAVGATAMFLARDPAPSSEGVTISKTLEVDLGSAPPPPAVPPIEEAIAPPPEPTIAQPAVVHDDGDGETEGPRRAPAQASSSASASRRATERPAGSSSPETTGPLGRFDAALANHLNAVAVPQCWCRQGRDTASGYPQRFWIAWDIDNGHYTGPWHFSPNMPASLRQCIISMTSPGNFDRTPEPRRLRIPLRAPAACPH